MKIYHSKEVPLPGQFVKGVFKLRPIMSHKNYSGGNFQNYTILKTSSTQYTQIKIIKSIYMVVQAFFGNLKHMFEKRS